MAKSMNQPVVVIPNLNGGNALLDAVQSLVRQTLKPYIIVVDNASTDGSAEQLRQKYPDIELIRNTKNEGYAGGVNPGIRRAIELGAVYVAPFNDDAIADSKWLESLVTYMDKHPEVGAAASKVMKADKIHLDSTGDYYTVWGLPYPRGRDEVDEGQYDHLTEIFAASGASSLYRIATLLEVGLFDENFFAYYEDVDLGFRMQLAGWKVSYVPESIVYHTVGMTSGRMKGFTTYQTMKNLPLLLRKNVPDRLLWRVTWRLNLAQILFFWRAVSRGLGWSAFKGDWAGTYLSGKATFERQRIQTSRQVSDDYIWNMMVHDLPPNAHALRKLRTFWWKLRGKKA